MFLLIIGIVMVPLLADRPPSSIIDIIDESDYCPLFTIVVILMVIGGQVSTPQQRKLGGLLSILAFLSYGAYAWDFFRPADASELLGITIRAAAAAGLMLGLSWMILPFLSHLTAWARSVRLRQREAAERAQRQREARQRQLDDEQQRQREQADAERRAIEYERQRAEREQNNQPEVRTRRAKEKYEAKLSMLRASGLEGIELSSACEEAKQRYLKELDEAMK